MSTKLIVGLGNPGQKYEDTRHNVGFNVVDRFAERLGVHVDLLKWDALVGETRMGENKLILMKPQTFMNASGKAVRQAFSFYKMDPSDLIVVVDDVEIHMGTIRIRPNGSSGSHNGMKSIIREVGSNEFPRVKVSVGRRPAQMDLADFVLSRFDSHEKKTLDEELEASVDALFEILEHDVVTAQNHWNGWIAPSVLAMSEEERRRRDELDRERARQEAFLKNAERCGD